MTLRAIVLLLILILISTLPFGGQENVTPEIYVNESYSNQIALNIYIEESGKALLAGLLKALK